MMVCKLALGSPDCKPTLRFLLRGICAKGFGGVEQHVCSFTKFGPKFVEDSPCCAKGVIE